MVLRSRGRSMGPPRAAQRGACQALPGAPRLLSTRAQICGGGGLSTACRAAVVRGKGTVDSTLRDLGKGPPVASRAAAACQKRANA
eukprot:8461221-Alexandrium_andersonii.AAC.1